MYSAPVLVEDAGVPVAAPAGWDPPALAQTRRNWHQWVGPAISVGVLVAALLQLSHLDRHNVLALVPSVASFWIAFLLCYATLPIAEWLIYRRLWGLPFSGVLPLTRKRISNEILLGYSGELYFYEWARRRAQMTSAPFGAIKDVTIMSAQVGNIATLLLLAVAWPMLGALQLGAHGRAIILSGGLIVATSLPIMLLKDRVFSLPRRELWAITGLHFARLAVSMLLTGWMWHEALPGVALSLWVMLSALRQLLSRLPLLPNKDIVFAGLTVYMTGRQPEVAAMIAMTASVTLVTHIGLGGVLGLADLLTPGRKDQEARACD